MPAKQKHPVVFIALPPAALATACGISQRTVNSEILAGRLGPVFQLGLARRILVSDAEGWIRTWKRAQPRKRKAVPHAS
jgi:hypothetical protein